MNAPARILQADRKDLDDLAMLFDQYRQFYEQAADLDACRGFLKERIEKDESVIFLAREQGSGKAIGFTQLYSSFCSVDMVKLIYLYDLFVIPEARKQGVARALLRKAARYAEHVGAGRLQLETAFDNLPAQTLYEDMGWKRDNTFLTYHLGTPC